MPDRQWPATKIGTAWLTYDPDDGWGEHDNPSDAEREFGAIVDHLRDESSDGWHESADTAAWGIWIPIERLRLEATAWPDDDTEDGERCKDAGWDAVLSGRVEVVPCDDYAVGFCTDLRAAAFAELRLEIERLTADRDTARAEADALRASLTEARAVITRIAVACATIDCEDLVAEHTTPDDYNDLVEHVERVVEDGHAVRASRARWTIAAGIASDTFCPQCGVGVRVDEDGCCRACGNGAMGAAVDSRRASIEEAEAADVAAGVDHG